MSALSSAGRDVEALLRGADLTDLDPLSLPRLAHDVDAVGVVPEDDRTPGPRADRPDRREALDVHRDAKPYQRRLDRKGTRKPRVTLAQDDDEVDDALELRRRLEVEGLAADPEDADCPLGTARRAR